MSQNTKFPTHIHFHPHASASDYEDLKPLIDRETYPFIIFLPEITPESVTKFQAIADGSKKLLKSCVQLDKTTNPSGTIMNTNAERNRALAELIFDKGLIIESVHPNFNKKVANDNMLALGKNRGLLPTLEQTAVACKRELPLIANIIRNRDDYTVANFRPTIERIIGKNPDLRELGRVPCVMEIGALHFQLAEKLQATGETIDVSGTEHTDFTYSLHSQALAKTLKNEDLNTIDYEAIALEEALSQEIRVGNTPVMQAVINTLINGYPRSEWPAQYDRIYSIFGTSSRVTTN